MVATDIKMIFLAPCSPCAFSPSSPWFQKNYGNHGVHKEISTDTTEINERV